MVEEIVLLCVKTPRCCFSDFYNSNAELIKKKYRTTSTGRIRPGSNGGSSNIYMSPRIQARIVWAFISNPLFLIYHPSLTNNGSSSIGAATVTLLPPAYLAPV